MKITLSLFAGCSLFAAAAGWAQETTKATRNPTGVAIEVTAGQEFYAETIVERIPAYRLATPFKSSMAGSMGLPFSFSIDTDLLVRSKKTPDGWEYFLPEKAKFRASHGLLGSVIRPGDTVGLMVHENGSMKWYVDNSVYTGIRSVYSRNVKTSDPQLTRVFTSRSQPTGAAVERLVYLGIDESKRARIRHERVVPGDILRDEYTFPLDPEGKGVGAVRGAEFSIHAGPLRAEIVVNTAMTSGLGERAE